MNFVSVRWVDFQRCLDVQCRFGLHLWQIERINVGGKGTGSCSDATSAGTPAAVAVASADLMETDRRQRCAAMRSLNCLAR